jgi:hypothetical protein
VGRGFWFRMRSYKPRFRVAAGVARKGALNAKVVSAKHGSKLQLCHR